MRSRLPSVLVLHNIPRCALAEQKGSGALSRKAPDPLASAYEESDAGVLAEVAAVEAALDKLGAPHRTAGATRLADIPGILAAAPEEVVFNLVESFPGRAADANDVPALARAFGKGCTGSDTPCLVLALDKWQTKALLRAARLPCPAGAMVPVGGKVPAGDLPRGPLIVKPVAADASEGIDSQSVIARPGAALRNAVRRIHAAFGQPALIEEFVGTRELNVSVLERGRKVVVLPIAETDFSAFDAKRPRIVGYTAKWLVDSFEYRHTPRLLPARLPGRVARRVRDLALAAWRTLGCGDYARVDFRLTEEGEPVILEVNPNPDISPDDGFAAALAAAGIAYEEFVAAVVANAAARAASNTATQKRGAVPSGDSKGSRRASPPAKCENLTIRYSRPADRDAILAAAASTRFLREDELVIAAEVLDEALAKDPGGHYQSFTAVLDGRPVGWVCHGPTPCTLGTFDIYWIVVAAEHQGRGIGKSLVRHAEDDIRRRGGRLAIVETNSRPLYEPTRRFYLRAGYHEASRVADFYTPGDDKIIYAKRLVP